MASTNELEALEEKKENDQEQRNGNYLQRFQLYETRSTFYMTGLDKSSTFWRVLKIDRLDPTVLTIEEDPTIYTEAGCKDFLKTIRQGNASTGGLKFRTVCYGIIGKFFKILDTCSVQAILFIYFYFETLSGFVKFLAPYYIYVITKRKNVGAIGAHKIYSIAKCELIPLQYSTGKENMAFSMVEDRYKRLLCSVDLTKDFFFSYSYNVMCTLQNNIFEGLTGPVLYEKMFVWNEFLTREIRHQVTSTAWTVALVHGFFKQVKLSINGRDFKLALIARRSRYYAGTRYLKRGVNKNGRVANDVDTEQILFEVAPEGSPVQISAVVQNRGSIPLFWSQDSSRLSIKPDITLSKKDRSYEATKLHFQDLVDRYGNPIIILNLIKQTERKPRESILRAEFANAIEFINKDLLKRLQFVHWDLQEHFRRKKDVFAHLGKISSKAMRSTGFFYCQITPELVPVLLADNSETGSDQQNLDTIGSPKAKSPMFQIGVLRTNCIDCLDRTNVAQYTYGLAAIGHQLHALGFIDAPKFDLKSPIAKTLMWLYEAMGDTIALQYGGSLAHSKIFAHYRGESKAAIQSQELIRSVQRYCSNAFMDAEKQDAINMFLGYFRPQQGKPALWELDAAQLYSVGTCDDTFGSTLKRLSIKRSFSDGNMKDEITTPVAETKVWETKLSELNVAEITADKKYIQMISRSELFVDMQSGQIHFDEDVVSMSSSRNAFNDERERFKPLQLGADDPNSTSKLLNSNTILDQIKITEAENSYARYQSSNIQNEFSDSFACWVNFGEALCRPHQQLH
ncbi:hypothetical protein ACHQM5_029558 [Ranunculus cassubicifolius]